MAAVSILLGSLALAGVGCALGTVGGAGDEVTLIGAGHMDDVPEARSTHGVVAAGSPQAARAGVEILAAGGNAVDAAVAAAFTLTATDPGDSGLGGQTFVLIHLADGRDVAVDGAAPVPLTVDRGVLRALKRQDRLFGYPVVAVPTTVAALAHALERYGTMSFDQVLKPAVAAAREGYTLGFCEQAFIGSYVRKLRYSPVLGPFTLAGGRPRPVGSHMALPGILDTLQRVAAGGPEEFYRGAVAHRIAADMAAHGGFVSLADLGTVRVREREPVRGRYRRREVVSFPWPCGGPAVVEALAILDQFPAPTLARPSLRRLQLLAEAVHIATHDVDVRQAEMASPWAAGLEARLPAAYDSAGRAGLIRFDRALTEADLGAESLPRPSERNTVQVSVRDADGNVVSLTQTLGRCYGACVATPGLGFPYNSLLEPYNLDDPANPYFLRPRSVMPTWIAPTIVLDRDGRAVAALGSAGSGRIISVVVDTLVNLEDARMSLGQAVGAARVMWGGPGDPKVYLEMRPPHTTVEADALEALGYEHLYRLRFPARAIDLTAFGGVNAVARDPATSEWVAAADPRRTGGVAAQP